MIISHSKQTLVVRVPKTGSTTLESVIRMTGCTQEEDTCSPVEDVRLPEKSTNTAYLSFTQDLKDARISMRAKQRYAQSSIEEIDYTDKETAIRENGIRNQANRTFKRMALNHSTLDDLTDTDSLAHLELITEEQIKSYKTYAFIRNPLKRALSSFVFSRHGHQSIPILRGHFHDVVLSDSMHGLVYRDQHHYHDYQGQRIATPLLFEDFTDSVNSVVTYMGGTVLAELPRFKSGNDELLEDRPSVQDWIDPYPNVRDALLERYSEDVLLWESVSGETLA
tara:strand:- start:3356 stop:4195 length:840 start_codon:yes stop_codon:yes gene_type:complete